MLIYAIIFFLTTTFAVASPKQKINSIITVIILCILIFFRNETVGTDVMNYYMNFKKITFNESSWNYYIPFEPGFNYFILLFKNLISNNPMACWGFIGVVYVLGFYKFVKRYTQNINVALFCFYALGTYFLAFNIMRQCFACALILILFSYINIENPSRKEMILSAICITFIGLMFHPTILIFFIYLLYHIKIINSLLTKRTMIILLLFSFIIFYTQAIIPFITSLIDSTSAEGKLINYATKNIQNDENSGFSIIKLILITFFQIYIILTSSNVKNIFLFIGTCSVIFLNCFGILVLEFVRVYELLICFQIPFLAKMWNGKDFNILTIIYKPALLIYLFVTFFNILIKNYGEIVPFHFRPIF